MVPVFSCSVPGLSMATLSHVPGTSWPVLLPVLFPCPVLSPLGELPTRCWSCMLWMCRARGGWRGPHRGIVFCACVSRLLHL